MLHHPMPGGHRPRPPADPAIGDGQPGGIDAPNGQVSLDINETSSNDAHISRNLLFELRIGDLIGFTIQRQHRDTPPEPAQIARVLQSPQHPAAAAFRGIVVSDEEGVPHLSKLDSVLRRTAPSVAEEAEKRPNEMERSTSSAINRCPSSV